MATKNAAVKDKKELTAEMLLEMHADGTIPSDVIEQLVAAEKKRLQAQVNEIISKKVDRFKSQLESDDDNVKQLRVIQAKLTALKERKASISAEMKKLREERKAIRQARKESKKA